MPGRLHRHARPVLWKGTLAKLAVVAVPNGNAAVLSLQRTDSDTAVRTCQSPGDSCSPNSSVKGGCSAESSQAVRPEKEGRPL